MATRKIVPRADNEGGLGTAVKRWASAFINALTVNSATIGSLAGVIFGTAGTLSALEYVPWTTPAFNAGNFSGSGAMTWTVEAGDVTTYAYTITGKKMTVAFVIGPSVIGGTPSDTVCIKVPTSKTIAKTMYGVCMSYNNSVWAAARMVALAIDTWIRISINVEESAAWTAGNSYVRGQITFEIN
jgi:hypothetical protein